MRLILIRANTVIERNDQTKKINIAFFQEQQL